MFEATRERAQVAFRRLARRGQDTETASLEQAIPELTAEEQINQLEEVLGSALSDIDYFTSERAKKILLAARLHAAVHGSLETLRIFVDLDPGNDIDRKLFPQGKSELVQGLLAAPVTDLSKNYLVYAASRTHLPTKIPGLEISLEDVPSDLWGERGYIRGGYHLVGPMAPRIWSSDGFSLESSMESNFRDYISIFYPQTSV